MLTCGLFPLLFALCSGLHFGTNENGTNITTLDILFLRGYNFIQNETRIVIEMAEEQLRREHKVPPSLQFNMIDLMSCTRSTEEEAFDPLMDATREYYAGSQPIDVIVGPYCSPGMRYVARLATEWNLPIFGYVSVNAEFANRAQYPTLCLVMITISSMADATISLLKHLDIKQLGVAKDPDGKSVATMWIYDGIMDALAKTDINVNADIDVFVKKKETLPASFQRMRDTARIFIIIMDYGPNSEFMEELVNHNMTGPEYFYILPCGPGKFSAANLISDAANLGYSKTFLVHAEGLDSETVAAFHDRMRTEKGVTFGTEGLRYYEKFFRTRFPIVHDSFYLYMLVAAQLLQDNKTDVLTDGLGFYSNLPNRNFIGASGHVWIDGGGERLPDYVVDTVVGGEIKRVIRLDVTPVCDGKCHESQGQIIGELHYIWIPKIIWPEHGGLPPEMPECGFRGELCDKTMIYLTVFIIFMTIVLAVIAYKLWRKMQEEKLHRMPWRIRLEQIVAVKKNLLGSLATIRTDQNSMASGNLEVVLVGRDLCTVTVHHQEKAAEFSRTSLAALNELKKVQHENLCGFVGLCFDNSDKEFQILWTTGARGPLQQLIFERDIDMEAMFQASFIRDIVRGLEFIHNSSVRSHGSLSISSCFVTQQWMVKVSHFGMQDALRELCSKSIITHEGGNFLDLVHIAPELPRQNKKLDNPWESSQKDDIYSLGMIIYQILYRSAPYLNPEAIINQILSDQDKLEMPHIPVESVITNVNLRNLEACFSCDPNQRPNLIALKNIASALSPARGGLVDNMMKMMERYAGNLERLVRERTAMLEDAQRQADTLLFRMLPQTIALDLKAGKAVEPKLFHSATVSFTDIVGFTPLCSQSSPLQIVSFLNGLYSRYDEIIAIHDAYKVETIGDAYLVVSGLPNLNGDRHAHEICSIAIAMRRCADNFKLPHLPDKNLKVRIGIDTGSVAAGVIGITAPRYCIFGDTVNTASRMESTGETMKIQMSHGTKVLLDQWSDKFVVQERGQVSVKTKKTKIQAATFIRAATNDLNHYASRPQIHNLQFHQARITKYCQQSPRTLRYKGANTT